MDDFALILTIEHAARKCSNGSKVNVYVLRDPNEFIAKAYGRLIPVPRNNRSVPDTVSRNTLEFLLLE